MSFTLKQLGYFVAVAEAGSVRAAAARLFLSESALASALNELERSVGTQLCVRRKSRGITLTHAGAAFLDGARNLLTSSEELEQRMSGTEQEPAGPYKFGTFRSVSPSVVPPLLHHFRECMPKVEADFTEGAQDELEEMLLMGHIESALMYDLGSAHQLEVMPLHAIEPRIILPPTHRFARRESIGLHEMEAEDLILVRAAPNRSYVAQLFAEAGLRPRVRHTTTDSMLCRALVAAEVGYSVLIQPPFAPSRRIMADVAEVPIHPTPPPIQLALFTRRGSAGSAKNQAVISFLRTWVSAAFAPGE